jgi:hypothetical protein
MVICDGDDIRPQTILTIVAQQAAAICEETFYSAIELRTHCRRMVFT